MNRRGFLKLCAAAGITVALPDIAPAAAPLQLGRVDSVRFIESREYGRMINLLGVRKWTPELEDAAIDVACIDARDCLPAGTPFQIRSVECDYGRDRSVAWYYSPRLLTHPDPPLGWVMKHGYKFHGRHIA